MFAHTRGMKRLCIGVILMVIALGMAFFIRQTGRHWMSYVSPDGRWMWDSANGLTTVSFAPRRGAYLEDPFNQKPGMRYTSVGVRDEDGWFCRLIGARLQWYQPGGGNEIVPPHANAVWYVPGVMEYSYMTIWTDGTPWRSFGFVMWPVPAVLGLVGVWLMWRGRRVMTRAKRGLCVACGYSRAGL